MVHHRLLAASAGLTAAVACAVAALPVARAADAVRVVAVATAADAPAAPQAAGAAPLKLEKGDHICIVGNTLAERFQHDGWLEGYLYARNPDLDLVVRNLGYSADEIDYSKRLRSKDFGTPDEWLAGQADIPTVAAYRKKEKKDPDAPPKIGNPKDVKANRFEGVNTKADVIFAFFGYNESFAGEKGLPKFKADLTRLLAHYAEQKYNGKSAPRVVLFSPIAHEDLKDPNLPDGKADNERLKLYAAAIADVAKESKVGFVDLFEPSQKLYAAAAAAGKPLTMNGIHLTPEGNRQIASVIDAALTGGAALSGRDEAKFEARLEPARKAAADKAWHWFHRYRATDLFSTYGDRGFLQFTDKQSNYEVLQRELEVLDVMVQNRDKAIWAAAKGQPMAKVDDANVPQFLEVKTNKKDAQPYKSGEEAMKDMTLAKGLKVSLFADEKRFPELIKPVQMSFDTKGRLWVAVWPSYPHWQPTTPMADKILIFEDTDNDGVADKVKTFAGDLHNPTGFEFYNGGIVVAQGPDIWFMKDTDGDDKADVRTRILHGFDTTDTHHTANSFTFDPGGALYWQEGTFMHTQVETPWGPPVRNANSAVYRYEPKTLKLDVYTAYSYANPHGHVFDRWGTDIITDGTGAQPYYGPAFSGHMDFPAKHPKAPVIYKQRTRPCPGIELLVSGHFPPEMQGNLIVGNVIGFQGFLNYKLTDKGAGVEGKEVEPLLQSSDVNFRPSDLEVAPDGSLYFTDWQNSIIGHMQHNLRDPMRDREHGRIYRITAEGRPLLTPPKIAGEPVAKLLDLLKSKEDRVVYRAKIELSAHKADEVVPAVKAWVAGLDKADADYEHQRTEALWLHQWNNVVDVDLLKQVLASPEPKARAAATRVLCYWRDRVPTVLELLKKQAQDKDPRVALEAVRAASFFGAGKAEAASEVALEAVEKHGEDPVLKYTLDETMKQLDAVQKAPKVTQANYERETAPKAANAGPAAGKK
jgi:glucose/arabinose dehydrogenase